MKKIIILILFIFLIMPYSVYAYTDVPINHWANNYIKKATELEIISGTGQGEFGIGKPIKNAEFVVMLCNLMNWETSNKGAMWYDGYINEAYSRGIINKNNFKPEDYITRKDMAEILIKALGFKDIQTGNSPFTDINNCYVTAAYDFGIISGKEKSIFAPVDYASREEGAAMMCRLYDKYYKKLSFIHGFYAISSWNQKEIAADMDRISYGWSRLEYNGKVFLNSTSVNGNDWKIPESSDEAKQYFTQNNTPQNLAVTMNTSQQGLGEENACQTILLYDDNRTEAINQIIELSKDFDGVTIDFEGMKGEDLKQGLTLFLKELRVKLPENKVIFTAVHPIMNSSYFDGYDYKSIAEISDMVILMAHDYGAVSMNENERNSGFYITPVTPFDEVYIALKQATEEIENTDKIALALSVASTTCWSLDKSGKVINEYSFHPNNNTINKRLGQSDTIIEYSNKYRNPMATYTDDNGNKTILWYENKQSIKDKIILAKMFGINKVSIWRLGQITDDIWTGINELR